MKELKITSRYFRKEIKENNWDIGEDEEELYDFYQINSQVGKPYLLKVRLFCLKEESGWKTRPANFINEADYLK